MHPKADCNPLKEEEEEKDEEQEKKRRRRTTTGTSSALSLQFLSLERGMMNLWTRDLFFFILEDMCSSIHS